MRLVKTVFAHAHNPKNARYYANGVRISAEQYYEFCSTATRSDSFLTEQVSLAGGFLGYRHSKEVYHD